MNIEIRWHSISQSKYELASWRWNCRRKWRQRSERRSLAVFQPSLSSHSLTALPSADQCLISNKHVHYIILSFLSKHHTRSSSEHRDDANRIEAYLGNWIHRSQDGTRSLNQSSFDRFSFVRYVYMKSYSFLLKNQYSDSKALQLKHVLRLGHNLAYMYYYWLGPTDCLVLWFATQVKETTRHISSLSI